MLNIWKEFGKRLAIMHTRYTSHFSANVPTMLALDKPASLSGRCNAAALGHHCTCCTLSAFVQGDSLMTDSQQTRTEHTRAEAKQQQGKANRF